MQSRLSSIIEIAKGTVITIGVTALCESALPTTYALILSLIVSTALKYALRRYYNNKTIDK